MFQWAACNDRVADCHRKLADFDSEYALPPLLYLGLYKTFSCIIALAVRNYS